MKKLLMLISTAFALTISFSALADKIVVTGKPVVIEKRGEVYYVPQNYTVSTSFNYVTIDGVPKICFLEPQANLSSTVTTINININGVSNTWNCYNPEPTYFDIR